LTVVDAMKHPWIADMLNIQHQQPAADSMKRAMDNLRQFTKKPQFYVVAMANVARNLDSHGVGEVRDVFKALDTNQDGLLSLDEMRNGFEKVYGADSDAVMQIEELFKELDLDGSGTIDYTEFLAAGMGERIEQNEEVLWTAFRNFNASGDGKLRKDEICRALHSGDVSQEWGGAVCTLMVQQVMEGYDKSRQVATRVHTWSCVGMGPSTLRTSRATCTSTQTALRTSHRCRTSARIRPGSATARSPRPQACATTTRRAWRGAGPSARCSEDVSPLRAPARRQG